jgi:3-keto-disaccharide hydrolase
VFEHNRRNHVRFVNHFIAGLLTVAFTSGIMAADWRALPLIKGGQIASEWQHAGWGKMIVEGDAVRTDPSEKGLGLLVYTTEKLGDCQIRIVYRPKDVRSNAGVHIRMDDGILSWIGKDSIAVQRDAKGKLSPDMLARMKEASEKEEGAWYAVHHGYEVQVMDSADAFHRTGSIYSYAPAADLPEKPADGWRTMIITLQGNLVLVELDGKPITRFDSAAKDLPERKNWPEPKRDYPRPTHGYIGLQTHDPGDIVYFKEISVRPLDGQH